MNHYGSAHQMKLLGEAYFELSNVFAINIVMALVARVVSAAAGVPGIIIALLALFGVVTALTLKPNRKIGEALGWTENGPMIASVLMGLNSALCCGAVGYIVVQGKASRELRNYGIRPGFLGINKKEFYRALDQRLHEESSQIL
jgi:hypothetical protein